jgi:hypothetical protein
MFIFWFAAGIFGLSSDHPVVASNVCFQKQTLVTTPLDASNLLPALDLEEGKK